MRFDVNNPYYIIFAAVIASILSVLIMALYKVAVKRIKFVIYLFKSEKYIDLYKATINRSILDTNHPWLKNGLTLKDVLILSNFHISLNSNNIMFNNYIENILLEKPVNRIIICGKPGSGKTTTMKIIANSICSKKENHKLIPIYLNYSDLRNVTDDKKMELKLVELLKIYKVCENEELMRYLVSKNLYNGNFILLVDGYDEVDRDERKNITKFLKQYFETYKQISFIIASRTEICEKELPFNVFKPDIIELLPLNNYAIREFVTRWKFIEGKSSYELYELIINNSFLLELSLNPLMLTIITFIYSYNKSDFPTNRNDFYYQCIKALLTDWDNFQQRQNQYEFFQKEKILCRFAYEIIIRSSLNDNYLDEEQFHIIIRDEIKNMGICENEYILVENEIIQNSGLMQKTIHNKFCFVHETFREYFLARYLERKNMHEFLLNSYRNNPEFWKNPLLFFIGINDNINIANIIFSELHGLLKDGGNYYIVVDALIENKIQNLLVVETILNEIQEILKLNPDIRLIEKLKFIICRENFTYANKTKIILLEMLDNHFNNDELFQSILLSLIYSSDVNILNIVLNNIKRINLDKYFSHNFPTSRYFIHKLLSLSLSIDEKNRIINSIKQAGNLELLGSLLSYTNDKTIKEICAITLFSVSKSDGFMEFISKNDEIFLDEDTSRIIDIKIKEWGWKWDYPESFSGIRMAFVICYFSSIYIENNENMDSKIIDNAHSHFRFLTTCFICEKGIPFDRINLIDFNNGCVATVNSLKKYWKGTASKKKIRYKISYLLQKSNIKYIMIVFYIFYIASYYLLQTSIITHQNYELGMINRTINGIKKEISIIVFKKVQLEALARENEFIYNEKINELEMKEQEYKAAIKKIKGGYIEVETDLQVSKERIKNYWLLLRILLGLYIADFLFIKLHQTKLIYCLHFICVFSVLLVNLFCVRLFPTNIIITGTYILYLINSILKLYIYIPIIYSRNVTKVLDFLYSDYEQVVSYYNNKLQFPICADKQENRYI